jgi:hypothetical protein
MTIYYLENGEIDRVRTNAREIDGGIEGPGAGQKGAGEMSGRMAWPAEAVAAFTQPGIERPMRGDWDIRELLGGE